MKEKISWLHSYLTDRTQKVRINNTVSSKRLIKIGTVQGSKISPLLFLCLLIDIKDEIASEEAFYQFADNINILVFGDTTENITQKLQNINNKISNYLNRNQLALNYDKFLLLIISKDRSQHLPIEVNIQGQKIREGKHVKHWV